MSAHVDYVVNDWDGEAQHRRCSLRVGTDGDEAGDLVVKWYAPVTNEASVAMFLDWCWQQIVPPNWPHQQPTPDDLRRLTTGPEQAHFIFTEPHDEADCPFGDGSRLAMERIEPSDELRLLTPAEVAALPAETLAGLGLAPPPATTEGEPE